MDAPPHRGRPWRGHATACARVPVRLAGAHGVIGVGLGPGPGHRRHHRRRGAGPGRWRAGGWGERPRLQRGHRLRAHGRQRRRWALRHAADAARRVRGHRRGAGVRHDEPGRAQPAGRAGADCGVRDVDDGLRRDRERDRRAAGRRDEPHRAEQHLRRAGGALHPDRRPQHPRLLRPPAGRERAADLERRNRAPARRPLSTAGSACAR